MQQLSPWPRSHLSHWAVAHTQSPLAMMCPSELRHRNSHPGGSPFPRGSSSLTTDSALHSTVQRELREEQSVSPKTLAAQGHLAKASLTVQAPGDGRDLVLDSSGPGAPHTLLHVRAGAPRVIRPCRDGNSDTKRCTRTWTNLQWVMEVEEGRVKRLHNV